MRAGPKRGARGKLALASAAALCGLWASMAAAAADGARLLDDFENIAPWSALPADGVELRLSLDTGVRGRALRLDFDFGKGGGYAVARRELALDLPANYRFRLHVRGECGPQNFEFKLIDSTGSNVWWANRRDFPFPVAWDSISTRNRQIEFAWGPAGGGEIRHVAALEFAITAGSGGSGTVWLDELWLKPLPPPRAVPLPIVARGSSETAAPGSRQSPRDSSGVAWRAGGSALAVDGDSATAWESAQGDRKPELLLDLGEVREFGGLIVDWTTQGRGPHPVEVELSVDGALWRPAWRMQGSRKRDYVYLPEAEARYVRLRRTDGPGGRNSTFAISEVTIQPLAWSATMNDFLQAVARDQPRGHYPRGMSGEMVYWTVVGMDGGPEGLLSEDGAYETSLGNFSIEPFLRVDDRLLTWADFTSEQSLVDGELPLPAVHLRSPGVELEVRVAPQEGRKYATETVLEYALRNVGDQPIRGDLLLAIRPFQVNPPQQFLGKPGGFAPIHTIAGGARAGSIVVNRSSRVSLLGDVRFFASTLADDELGDLSELDVPAERDTVQDDTGLAWGVAVKEWTLAPGEEAKLMGYVSAPRAQPGADWPRWALGQSGEEHWKPLDLAARQWRGRLGQPVIAGPPSAREALETLRAQIGFVLVNRDGPAIQPGSRAYDRTWIRDGSLTCTALLRLGYEAEVREFLEWFAPFQYQNGKIPCCVDERGADPVPEHDSTGEFLYLVAEYYRYTGDLQLVRSLWPRVESGVAYLDSLRGTRRTAEWRTPENEPYFGLLPPSISHEGYSAKPMHSYWDDFFALRGLRDAAYLAEALGEAGASRRISSIGDEFEQDLAASLRAVQRVHAIDFVPGAADLGDFDATSTTIVLSPVQAESVPPAGALERTFERYYEFFVRRRDGSEDWEALTPYEMRNIGAFIRLGWRERAGELVDFFLRHRRPAGWRQWAEVVWRDERKPAFVGDMPHTWVGTDYVRSLLDAFAYERDSDDALVIAAGVPREWVREEPGVLVTGLRTPYGPLSYTMREEEGVVTARIESGLRLPAGGLRLLAPGVSVRSRATVNGRPARLEKDGAVLLHDLPATVRITLRQ